MALHENKKPTRLTQALLEKAKEMKKAGILTSEAYRKITMRHLGPEDGVRSRTANRGRYQAIPVIFSGSSIIFQRSKLTTEALPT
jgi:hypothetical protein